MDELAFQALIDKRNQAEVKLINLRNQVARLVSLDDTDSGIAMVELSTAITEIEGKIAKLEESFLSLKFGSEERMAAEAHYKILHVALADARLKFDEILVHFEQENHEGLDQKLVSLQEKLSLHVIDELEQALSEYNKIEDEVAAGKELYNSHEALTTEIEKAKESYRIFFDQDNFSITGAGNIFFTEGDKQAVSQFGAKEVEMENSLFLQIIHFAVANRMFIDEEYITKIAADPLLIETKITESLNEWAATYTMSLDDYVDAYMWALQGQTFDPKKFPKSGHWKGAEELYRHNPDLRKRFYNFGNEDNPIIVNPFWKEIGTDLLKEIAGGQAFSGTDVQLKAPEKPSEEQILAFHAQEDAFEAAKKDVQQKASALLKNPPAKEDEIRVKVREIFSDYLKLMKPMQVPGTGQEVRYRCYARNVKILPTGFVQQPIDDWDQPLYKSTNTAVLDKKSQAFVEQARGRQIGGGKAILPSDKPGGFEISEHNAALFLVEILRIVREERDFKKAVVVGNAFLAHVTPESLVDNALVAHIKRLVVNDGEYLRNKMAAYNKQETGAEVSLNKDTSSEVEMQTKVEPESKPVIQEKALETLSSEASKATVKQTTSQPKMRSDQTTFFRKNSPYPSILADYITREKLTGPRAATALEKIKEDHGAKVAKETGEKFIRWSISHGHRYSLKDIQSFITQVNKELEQQEQLPKRPIPGK